MPLKRLYVLASHEPNLDPRIDWVARFATNQFEVNVVGMADPSRPARPVDSRNGYCIERCVQSFHGFLAFAGMVCRCFGSRPLFWWNLALAILLAPIFVVPWLFIKIALRGVRAFCLMLISKNEQHWADRADEELKPHVAFLSKFARAIWIGRHFMTTSISLCHALQRSLRPDVIYCNDLDTLLAGVLLKRVFDCKLVYDAHEYWAHSDPASPWWEVRFFLWYERNLLEHVDAAFTVNPLLAEQMQTGLGHAFLSLPNCEPLSPPATAPLRRLQVREETTSEDIEKMAQGRVRFLFQGQFAPERGIIELIHLWSRVSREKAVLFLRGPDNEHRRPCVKLARELGVLGQSVFFLDPILESELVTAASEMDVGIIPYKPVTVNYRYCCPNKLSQYMQAGLAILANNLDFVKATIDQYECGLAYDLNDPDLTLAAINRLIDDEAFRHACQRQSRMMAVGEYNWEKQSRDLYEACARLAEIPLAQTDQRPIERVA